MATETNLATVASGNDLPEQSKHRGIPEAKFLVSKILVFVFLSYLLNSGIRGLFSRRLFLTCQLFL